MKYLGPPQSGSQAGTTASHNRAGQYFRNRRTPVTPTRTPKQGVLRAAFGSVSSAWQTLTSAAQAAWTGFAAGYPVVDSLGQSVVLTGHQYFVGVNTSLLNAGQAIVLTPPTNTTLNPLSPVTIYVDASGTFIVGFAPPVSGDFALVAASKILSAGRLFNRAFSQFAVGDSTTSYADISQQFTAQFGQPIAGKRVFGRLVAVNSSGMSASPVIVNTTVAVASTLTPGTITTLVAGQVVLTGADASALIAILESIDPVSGDYFVTQTQPVTGGGATFSGVASGSTVVVRVTDGSAFSAPTASAVVT